MASILFLRTRLLRTVARLTSTQRIGTQASLIVGLFGLALLAVAGASAADNPPSPVGTCVGVHPPGVSAPGCLTWTLKTCTWAFHHTPLPRECLIAA